MMNNALSYKGYWTEIHYSKEDCVLHGRIEGIDDLVCFDSENAHDIENAFHEAVDDYLETCRMVGKEPCKTYKGSFNVRMSPELHRQAAISASAQGITLNQFITNATKAAVMDA